MKNILLIICLLTSITAFAQPAQYVNARQDTTLLFSSPGYVSDPLRANWIRKVTKKDSLWILSLYDKKEILQERISFADEKLEVRRGPYSFYEDGNLQTEGYYDKGYKVGEWKNYYANKKLHEQKNYAWDKLVGNYKLYWADGTLKKEGLYLRHEQKSGIWKLYYKNGQLAYEENFDEKGVLIIGKYLNEEGKEVKESYVFEAPIYPEGTEAFKRYLAKAVKYPKKAFKNNIQGTVLLLFNIEKDGTINEVKVKESPDPELSKEAVRVLLNTKPWIPGKELGEPIRVSYTVPIMFAIKE